MLILVGGLLWWGYGGNVAVAKVRAVAISLKFCGFALLVICLLEPLWRDRSPKPGANLLAVVVDESRSLQILESDLEGSRAQQLKATYIWSEGPRMAESFGRVFNCVDSPWDSAIFS